MNTQTIPKGNLAAICGYELPLSVLQSGAGYYIGTCDEEGPVSRESKEYWRTYAAAQKALEKGDWTQRESL